MTPTDFHALLHVSRETLDRLTAIADLLVKWQRKINLVGPDTIPDLWRRHMLDSAQLSTHLPASWSTLVDLGSGAGFPGLILAVLHGGEPGKTIHLIESDTRKCAFLREAARISATPITLHNARIEAVPSLGADIVTARALAPLPLLLDWAEPHLLPEGLCLFLKGRTGEDELTAARKVWNITARRFDSLSDPAGQIFHLQEVRRGRV